MKSIGKNMKSKWFVDTKWSVWLLMLPVIVLLVLILEFHLGYNAPAGKTPAAAPLPHADKPIRD